MIEALRRAWPRTLSDPDAAERYAAALDGLDPAAVAGAAGFENGAGARHGANRPGRAEGR